MAEPRTFLPALIDGARRLLPAFGPSRASSPEDPATPPDMTGVYSRSPEMTILGNLGPWMSALLAPNDDSILKREGSQDLALFDRLLDDDVAMSNLQQRRLAITSKDWEVVPGDDKDPRSVQAADDFKSMLRALGFDRVTGLLHYAIWFGYGVGEAIWTTKAHNGRTIIWLDEIVVPDRRWFGFTLEGELRYVGAWSTFGGEALPPNKFLTIRTGGTHDFAFYGLGLAHWVYWPVWFKRTALKFWALYLEKLANPTALGSFSDQDGTKEKRTLIEALLAIGRDSAVIVPDSAIDKIKFMEAQRASPASSSYKDFVTENNEAIMRIVLGQPGTSKATPQGVGGKQAQVHQDVKAEIVKADADLICETLNETVATWLTRWNYGEDVLPPRVYRVLDNVQDLDTTADRDVKLAGIGIKRTEESVEQVYGDGYVLGEPVTPPGAFGGAGGAADRPPAAANDAGDPQAEADRRRAAFAAMEPAPLYVSRKLLNADELIAWAKGQGFKALDPAADLHVTILYSKTPVDWFGMGETWSSDPKGGFTVPAGGPRKVLQLGDDCVVLRFGSSDLRWRHEGMVERGASHDFESYEPHVTFAHLGDGVDLDAVEPFAGELRFGPEIFEEIKADPAPLSMFSAIEEDEIDRLTAALMDEANPVLTEFAASLKDAISEATAHAGGRPSLEGARVALLQAFERFPTERLARLTGLPLVAERAGAEAGAEDRVTA